MHAPERMYPRPDHPRTRGVYRRCRRRTAARAGSSPHTRGLLGVQGTVVDDARIIPAHAGFTRRRHRDQHRSEDHPRTRGVYATRASPHPPLPGSSPHTRGLPCRRECAHAPAGIIPAHAGFTRIRTFNPRVVGDHPRTRGVYAASARATGSDAGSSPHTRGLHGRPPPRRAGQRIIPAHAGFTEEATAADGKRHGSSPRVRGLLWTSSAPPCGSGIIPARAGFTPLTSPRPACGGDHPRACGVYPWRALSMPPRAGSSPRVRGLHETSSPQVSAHGIIPARAGFTAPARPWPAPRRDHPRACGVYVISKLSGLGSAGSSPRVRGLQGGGLGVDHGLRIIPARAGFTRQRRTVPQGGRDHPRACGVYDTSQLRVTDTAGSSPRVRGLPPHRLRHKYGEGIIPARAGFTPVGGWQWQPA